MSKSRNEFGLIGTLIAIEITVKVSQINLKFTLCCMNRSEINLQHPASLCWVDAGNSARPAPTNPLGPLAEAIKTL